MFLNPVSSHQQVPQGQAQQTALGTLLGPRSQLLTVQPQLLALSYAKAPDT